MTLNQILCAAAAVYPDAWLLEYWDIEKQQPAANRDAGDVLALFVVRELAATFDPKASDDKQLRTAAHLMKNAAKDLRAIAYTLEALADRKSEGGP